MESAIDLIKRRKSFKGSSLPTRTVVPISALPKTSYGLLPFLNRLFLVWEVGAIYQLDEEV